MNRTVVRMITRLNIGGPARQALLLTKELRQEWPTTLVSGAAPEHEGELTDPDVKPVRIPLQRSLHPARDPAAFVASRRIMKRVEPAIVHTHMAKAGVIGRLTSPPGARRVHTFHGHVLSGYFSSAPERFFVRVERALAKRTDILIAVSPQVRDELLELEVGDPDRFRVVPLGFDLTPHLAVDAPSGVLRAALGLDGSTPLVGAAGRLTAIKDYATLIRAIASLPGVHLALLGDGAERGPLIRLATSLGIEDRVHLPGWWRDMAAAWSDVDVVALSSLNEGTPVSLIEALACGRPVVATDVGGVAFVVEHGRTGLLTPARVPEALATGIESVLSDVALAKRLGTAGKSDVEVRFGRERLVADIRALYSELITS